MDAMFDLIIYLLKFSMAGGFLLLALKLMRIKKSSTIKAEVLHLQAKLSRARMALKGKIKKKSNVFRALIKVALTEGDPIDTSLKQLTENNLETSQDFQNYFDVSRKIVSLIHDDTNKNANSAAEVGIENDFMCSDFKTELDIIRIIKQMTDLSAKINILVETNNQGNPNYPLEKVDDLIFSSLVDVNRVFKDDNTQTDPLVTATTDSSKKVS